MGTKIFKMDTNIFNRLFVLIVAVFITAVGTAVYAVPELSYEELTTVTDNTIIITWQTSNEISSSGIEYGIGLTTATSYEIDTTPKVNYHYLTLENLYQNTLYTYRIFSKNSSNETTYGAYKIVQTLSPPSGQYLFTFATISDTQLANIASTEGARGRPYPESGNILSAAIAKINEHTPAFTVVKGDLIDNRDTDPTTQANLVKTKLADLTSPDIYPIPGNHDKNAFTDHSGLESDWYTELFGDIRFNASAAANPTADSIYNYSINTNDGYHFVFLDSVRQDTKGAVDTAWLQADLAANTTKKSFIFLHYVITTESMSQIPDVVIEEITDSDTVEWDKIDLVNRTEFLSTLATYESNIVGVFMGHIHDNSRYNIGTLDFPFVRTAATIQFPVGYNIYKVYSNGYMQSFYKVPDYTELSRLNITAEGYSDSYWEQEGLGSNYDRNFVYTYSSVLVPPTVEAIAPVNGATSIALNQNIIITFTKEMATTETQTALSFSPVLSGASYSWNSAKTKLTIAHSNLTASTNYTVTIGAAAKSSDGQIFSTPYSFSFTTGTSATSTPPSAYINPVSNDLTTDATPTFTGIATDEYSTIANVEYRIASTVWRDWKACTALNGAFNSTQEVFTFTVTPEVARGEHEIQIRCTNAAGISTESSFTSYSFHVVGTRPEITLKADGTEIINGDPIKTTPSFEVTIAAINSLTLSNLNFYLNTSAITATQATQTNNNTITYAFYNPTLTGGTYNVSVMAIDDLGNTTTKEANNLLVQTSGDPVLYGIPLNYPNPFNAGSQDTTISYALSKASNVSLNIFDLAGNVLVKKSYLANQDGGKAGYNTVTWDGKASNGNYVGNGIYVYLIIVDGKVIQNGKGKITVFKQ